MRGSSSSAGRGRWRPLVLVAVLVAASCGDSDEVATTVPPTADPAATAQPSATTTTAAPGTTAAPPTTSAVSTTVAPTTTQAPGPWAPYEDGENDCQRNSDYAPAPMCMPPDIDTMEITRGSPLTVVTVFRSAPMPSGWQLTIGFDLDNDASTGINEGIWAELHGIGPDLEFDYFADVNGEPFAQINEIAPGPEYTLTEAGAPDQGPLAVWTWLDEQTLQLVISDTLVPDAISGFEVAGHTLHPDYHDAFPDTGPLAWPG